MVTLALAAVALVAAAPIQPSTFTERDLAPALGAGAAAARADLAARRYGRLAARLAGDARPEVAFLRAVALDAAGRAGDALAALGGLDDALPELADRIRFLRGRSLEAMGRRAGAVRAYAAVSDGSLRAPAARLARARLLADAGERSSALDALAPIAAAPPPSEPGAADAAAAALLLAARIRARGPAPDLAGARRDLVECWAGHPIAPEARRCAAALRKLPGKQGARPTAADDLRRAEALLAAKRAAAAAAQLRPVVEGLPRADADAPFACRARAALGRAYRVQRRYAAAVALLGPVAERCADDSARAEALELLASALAARGERDQAIAAYRRVAREWPASARADQALFAAADLLERDGRLADAAEAFAVVAREAREASRRDEAGFRAAWLAKEAGDNDRAIAQLLVLEEGARGRDAYEEARAAYWRARLLAARGDAGRSVARAIWADLAARFPAGYYGLVARARLEQLAAGGGAAVPPLPPPTPGAVRYDPGDVRHDAHFRAGVALLRIGLDRAAAEELEAIDPGRLSTGDGGPALLVADLLHRAGDESASSLLLRTVARGALRGAPDGRSAHVWRLAYPRTFRRHVARWAPRAHVPVDLLQALMREESALDPRAVSPAGAVGVSQLMLPTAREVARALGLKRPTRRDLATPSLSIRLGARFLSDLMRRFGGSVAAALASYNAGPTAVARWLADRGDHEVDEFVEEIPIEETRGYVKRVLRSFAAYRLLYGGGSDDALDLLAPPRLTIARRPGAGAARVVAARGARRPAAPSPRPVRPDGGDHSRREQRH